MRVASEPVPVRIVTAPDASCGGTTWSGAVAMIRGRLARRFGEAVTVEHVTLFSPRFFEMADIAAEVQAGAEPPIVVVGDEIVSRGGKLSESVIARAVDAALPKAGDSALRIIAVANAGGRATNGRY